MRLKVILLAAAIALMVIIGALSVDRRVQSQPASQTGSNLPNRLATGSAVSRGAKVSPSQTAAPLEDKEGQVEKTLDEMDQVFAEGGERALPTLTAKLNHPEKRVRQAAVSHLVSLDDRTALPALRQAAEEVVDTDEKASLLQAIEYLELPSYTELAASGVLPPLKKNPHGLAPSKDGDELLRARQIVKEKQQGTRNPQ